MATYVPFSKLTALRRERGLSRAELGAVVGKSRFAIGKYERGERIPPLHVICALMNWSDGLLSFEDFAAGECQSTSHPQRSNDERSAPEH